MPLIDRVKNFAASEVTSLRKEKAAILVCQEMKTSRYEIL